MTTMLCAFVPLRELIALFLSVPMLEGVPFTFNISALRPLKKTINTCSRPYKFVCPVLSLIYLFLCVSTKIHCRFIMLGNIADVLLRYTSICMVDWIYIREILRGLKLVNSFPGFIRCLVNEIHCNILRFNIARPYSRG